MKNRYRHRQGYPQREFKEINRELQIERDEDDDDDLAKTKRRTTCLWSIPLTTMILTTTRRGRVAHAIVCHRRSAPARRQASRWMYRAAMG
jgi:hypothetical protein